LRPVFPDLLASEFSNREAIGEGHEGVNYSSRTRIAFGVPNVRRRAFKVVFPDAVCMAVDCGTDVVNRKAARLSGRNVAERNAIVIDRFFETKEKALAWAKAHPHFMTVRIVTPSTKQGTKLVATKDPRLSPRNIASSSKTSWAGSAE
jgi:hypothetical protein